MAGVDQTLVDALRSFAAAIQRGFESRGRYQPEDQLKAPVSALLLAAGERLGIKILTHTEIVADDGIGRPDIGVFTAGLLTGHVELKAPEKPADPTRLRGADKEQWERFKGLPNLLYCNGREFVLIRSGARLAGAALGGDPIVDGEEAVSESGAAKVAAVLREFLHWEPILLSNAPHEPLLPRAGGAWDTWPRLTDLFPWQESGLQFKRTWPIAEDPETLRRRWTALLSSADRAVAFKESRDLTITKAVTGLSGARAALPVLGSLPQTAPMPALLPYAYRSFDVRWAIIDPRVGDYLRPSLYDGHGARQVYMATKFALQLGSGAAVSASAVLPDLDFFNARGGRDIIPLWRDAAGHSPNVPDGLLPTLGEALGQPVSAEDLFAYCYAILAGPAYARTFAEALTIPGPRIPFTRNPKLFDEAVALGRELLFLHTYGERFVSKHQRSGRIPSGAAKCAKGVSGDTSEYPNSFSYDAATQVLVVGDGRFTKVAPEVYGFEVSGYRVVQRWLAGRMRDRSGKRTSPLDDIRPEHWTFDDDLLSLLWVLEHTVARYPQHASLLERIIASKHVTSVEMETPTFAERAGPRPSRRGNTVQETLNL